MTPMLLSTYNQDPKYGPVVEVTGTQNFRDTRPYAESFTNVSQLITQHCNSSGGHAHPVHHLSSTLNAEDPSIIKHNDLTQLVNLPFLRSQILKREFEGSAIKQSNKAKEIKRQRGKKQNLLSPDQQTSRQPASHTLARSALEEPRAYNIHNDTSVYTRLLGGRDQAKSRPSNPQRLQAALHLMTPTILYVQYSCIEGCRSQGTCVHFSFLVHGRALPDGLICQMCQAGDCEEGHEVNRMCVRHKQSVDTQTITNHREDVLATPHEMLAAMERFRRAWICDWDSTDPDSHAIATIDTVKPCSYYNTAAFQTDIHPTTATKTYIPDPRPQKRLKVSDYVHDTPKWLEDRLPASETFQPARLSSKFVAGTQNDQKTDNKPHSESIEQELDQRRFTFGAMDQTMFHSTDGPSLEWLLMQPLNV